MSRMIFSLKDLYAAGDFSISRQIEQTLLDSLRTLYNLVESDVEISQGCDSAYDFRMKDKLFELKIMSSSAFTIETSRFNGDISGLTATKADYYMIINPGYLYGKEVMKIRIVTVEDLKQAVRVNTKVFTYAPNQYNSLGSVCHQLDPKQLRHDFIGMFTITDKINNEYFVDFAKAEFFPLGRFCNLYVHSLL